MDTNILRDVEPWYEREERESMIYLPKEKAKPLEEVMLFCVNATTEVMAEETKGVRQVTLFLRGQLALFFDWKLEWEGEWEFQIQKRHNIDEEKMQRASQSKVWRESSWGDQKEKTRQEIDGLIWFLDHSEKKTAISRSTR